MSNGFILLHRSLEDHWLNRERRSLSRFEAWIFLLWHASYEERTVSLRGNLYHLKRGDVLWSQRELARQWRWSEKKLRGFLDVLEKEAMIRTHILPHRVTQITLVNYDTYQKTGRTEDSTEGRTEDAPKTQRSRRIKKVNAVNEEAVAPPQKRTLPEVSQLIGFFMEEHEKHLGSKYVVSRERDHGAAARLLKELGLDECKARTVRYFTREDAWAEANGYSILNMAAIINRLGSNGQMHARPVPSETQRILAEKDINR
jgi:hypothetical protein